MLSAPSVFIAIAILACAVAISILAPYFEPSAPDVVTFILGVLLFYFTLQSLYAHATTDPSSLAYDSD